MDHMQVRVLSTAPFLYVSNFADVAQWKCIPLVWERSRVQSSPSAPHSKEVAVSSSKNTDREILG